MGAGAIGCYLGGRLAVSQGVDVHFVGRERVQQELGRHGLQLRNFDEAASLLPFGAVSYSTDVATLADCTVVLCCVKSADTDAVAQDMAAVLHEDTLVVSMQNGLRNATTLRSHLGKRPVLAGIVDFNVRALGEGQFQRTTSGPLTVEDSQNPRWKELAAALRRSDFQVAASSDILSQQWTKLLVNLNNAVSALSGAPTRELLANAQYRRVVAAIIEEGVAVARAAGARPARLRGIPVGWMPRILRLPDLIARVVTRAQMKIDPEARSSMWEDISRGRGTEVDYLNGEVVAQAQRCGVSAPINERVVALVHEAEDAAQGSPGMSGDLLWAKLHS